MANESIISKFKEIVTKRGELDNALGAYVSLLYLERQRQKDSINESDRLYKTAEDVAKTYFSRFDANFYNIVKAQIASLDLSELDIRLILSRTLSETGYSIDSASSVEMAHLVSDLMEVVPNESILDFGSGNGAFLCGVEFNLINKRIPACYIGVEPSISSAPICELALATLGCFYDLRQADGFSQPTPSYNKGFVFPPAGLKLSRDVIGSTEHKELFNSRTSSEWAFVLKALEGMKNGGKLIALLPESCLFKDADTQIRKYLLDQGLVEGIISFPAKSMVGTFRKNDLVILSKGNASLRLVDCADLFRNLEIRSFNDMAVEAIRYSYQEGNADIFLYEDVNPEDYSLVAASLCAARNHDDETGTMMFGVIYNFDKGSPKTIANFKDSISMSPTNWKLLSSGNIIDGEIDYDSMPYVYNDPSLEQYEAVPGDIVITTKSSKVKIAIIEEHLPYRIAVIGAMLILRPRGGANQLYTKLFLESEKGQRILAAAQRGTVVSTLSPAILSSAMIPFPPIEEQEAFVADYRTKQEEARTIREKLKSIEEQLEHYFDKRIQKGE